MNRLRALTLLFLSLLTSYVQGFAQSPEDKKNKSLLWKISGGDLNKPSYLFGTMHIVCPKDYIWTKKMEEALAQTTEVCFEMDMDAPVAMMAVTSAFSDVSGKTLKDHFGEENYKKVSDYMRDSLGMDISLFNNMVPTVLPVLFSKKNFKCDSEESYEEKIMRTAKLAGKEIQGLEDPEEQISLIRMLSPDTAVSEIMDIVNGKTVDTNSAKLIAAYKEQDLPALNELINSSKDLEGHNGQFIDDRNIKWVPRMIEMMDQKSMFFAVGAGHLWGDNGVINLLKKEGYTVSPIK